MITALSWSPDGRWLAVGGGMLGGSVAPPTSQVQVWDVAQKKRIKKFTLPTAFPRDYLGASASELVWSRDTRYLVTLPDALDPTPQQIIVWQVDKGQQSRFALQSQSTNVFTGAPHLIAKDARSITTLRAASINNFITPANEFCIVEERDLTTRRVLKKRSFPLYTTFEESNELCAAITGDGARVALLPRTNAHAATRANPDLPRTLQLIEVSTGKKHLIALPKASSTAQPSVVFASDGSALAVLTDKSHLMIFDGRTGTSFCTLRFRGFLRSFALSHDGNTLATWANTGQIILWDAHTGQQQREVIHAMGTIAASQHLGVAGLSVDSDNSHLKCLVFSPDASTLAVAADNGTVTLWRVR